MKVLVLASSYRGIGGAETYTRFLTQAVAGGGAEVDVLSLLDGDADDEMPGRYLGHQGTHSSPCRFTARTLGEAQGLSSERIYVIYPSVDPVLLALAESEMARPREGPVRLLTVARLSAEERYKGCDTVIHALPFVLKDAGPVQYVIVGDGDDRPRLERLAERAGMKATVTFMGYVSKQELAAQYRA